jgi:hypothetical protein
VFEHLEEELSPSTPEDYAGLGVSDDMQLPVRPKFEEGSVVS